MLKYKLTTTDVDAAGKITPAEATVTAGTLALKQKTYDQTAEMEVEGEVALAGLIEGDAEKVAVAGVPTTVTVEDKNYGVKHYTVKADTLSLIGDAAANYTIKAEDMEIQGWIKKRFIEVKEDSMKFQNKTYDGSAALDVVGTPELVGVLEGDEVIATYHGSKKLATQYGKLETRANVGDKGMWIARSTFYPFEGADGINYVLGHAVKLKGKIAKASLKSVTLKANTAKYTGKAITPVIKNVTTAEGKNLAKTITIKKEDGGEITRTHYKVTYTNKATGKEVKTIKAKGTYIVTVTPIYTAGFTTKTVSATFTVK